jgi:hypothetical protein
VSVKRLWRAKLRRYYNLGRPDVMSGLFCFLIVCFLEFFECGLYGLYVFFNFHLAPDVGDFAVFIDEEGGAFDAHEGFAVHAFFFPCAVLFADVAVLVRSEGEVEAVFGFEVVMLFDGAFG